TPGKQPIVDLVHVVLAKESFVHSRRDLVDRFLVSLVGIFVSTLREPPAHDRRSDRSKHQSVLQWIGVLDLLFARRHLRGLAFGLHYLRFLGKHWFQELLKLVRSPEATWHAEISRTQRAQRKNDQRDCHRLRRL